MGRSVTFWPITQDRVKLFQKFLRRQVSGNCADQGEYFWNSSEPYGGFYVSKTRGNWLMGLFVPLRSAPRPPILAQIWIFLAQNLDNYVVVHPLFELG